jgi:subtilisin family serine protease
MNAPPVNELLSGEKGGQCLVGVIDGGIDVSHPAFVRGGVPRIRAIWDLTGSAGGPSPADAEPARFGGLTEGVYYDRSRIAAIIAGGTAPSALLGQDDGGHGTAVTGVAAGAPWQESAGGPSHAVGIAEEAPLVVVIVGDVTWSDRLQAALRFLNECAKEAELPLVVNMSIGGHFGAHDGTVAIERVIDAFSDEPGRLVVKSAGNDRFAGLHARIHLSSAAPESLAIQLAGGATTADDFHATIEFWAESGSLDGVRLALRSDDGIAAIAQAGPGSSEWPSPAGDGLVQVTLLSRHPDNDLSHVLLSFDGIVPAGRWTLDFEGDVSVVIDAWVERSRDAAGFLDHTEPERTLTAPGNAQRILTVGGSQGLSPGLGWSQASMGPTRDGRALPLLAAAAEGVPSTEFGTLGESRHQGTSFAAPQITGVAALVFSASHRAGQELTAEDLLAAAKSSLSTPLSAWQEDLGYGTGVQARVLLDRLIDS